MAVTPYKTSYPELPFTQNVAPTYLSYGDAIRLLLKHFKEGIAKAVFAVLFAEASKSKDRKGFVSPGGFNYAGVQTDAGRWGSSGIIGQFSKVDSGGRRRSFAIFKDNESFLKFMGNRIAAKGLDGNDPHDWTADYIQKWWSPEKKAEYTQGTDKYNQKLSIYNVAISSFNKLAKAAGDAAKNNMSPILTGLFIGTAVALIKRAIS